MVDNNKNEAEKTNSSDFDWDFGCDSADLVQREGFRRQIVCKTGSMQTA